VIRHQKEKDQEDLLFFRMVLCSCPESRRGNSDFILEDPAEVILGFKSYFIADFLHNFIG
jgi:hypothetical protein